MRTSLSELWSTAVTVEVRPNTCRRRIRGIAVGILAGAVVAGSGGLDLFGMPVPVRLVSEDESDPVVTVGLNVFDGIAPFDSEDGPGLDSGPSNSIVREGDPVNYVVDIGVRGLPVRDALLHLPVPRGFSVTSVPDYCGDGSNLDDSGLSCRVGDLEPDGHFTRVVTMTAGPRSETDGLPVAAVVSADGGAVHVRSDEVTVRVATTAGVCDPRGVSVPGRAVIDAGPVQADGRISGLVTSGPAERVTIEGTDECGQAIVRSMKPFDGRFSFVGLVPGSYRLTVDGRAPTDVVVRSGAMTVDGVTF